MSGQIQGGWVQSHVMDAMHGPQRVLRATEPHPRSPSQDGKTPHHENFTTPASDLGTKMPANPSRTKELIGPLSSFVPPSSCFAQFNLTAWRGDFAVSAQASWGGTSTGDSPCYPSAS